MNKEIANKINTILSEKEIDNRVKPLIKLYFLGKSKELTSEQLDTQIDTLCSRISNVEFTTNNIIAAYERKAGVLSINKKLLIEGKADEVILPVFMKFESALNQENRRDYANNLEDFINATKVATAISIPISDRLYKLYEMVKYSYADEGRKVDKFVQDGAWKAICSKYNSAINRMIITGEDDSKELIHGVSLFHFEVFNLESLQNSNYVGPYKNEEYQKRAARILSYIDDSNKSEGEGLLKNIKLFTGCTEEMIERAKKVSYNGNPKIGNLVELSIKSGYNAKPSEDYIVSKVQAVIDNKPDWDSRLKHLIIPFFIRSQKIYNWNIDEFQERLNELNLKIDIIKFEDLEDLSIMADTAIDKIRLNSKVFFSKSRKASMACYETSFP